MRSSLPLFTRVYSKELLSQILKKMKYDLWLMRSKYSIAAHVFQRHFRRVAHGKAYITHSLTIVG